MQNSVSLDRCEKEIMAGKGQGLLGALRIGKALEIVSDGNLWVQVGAKSFDSYVSNTHGFSRSTAYNMISVARYFGPLLLADPSLQTVDPSRLVKLLPLVTEENKEELLHMAANVPDAAGFDANLRNKKGKTAPDECSHPDGYVPFLEKCPICEHKRKIKQAV